MTYLGLDGNPVSGFLVEFTLHKWNEGHMVNVPQLLPTIVQAKIEQVLKEREALDKLGV
jgi:hypothetical protein